MEPKRTRMKKYTDFIQKLLVIALVLSLPGRVLASENSEDYCGGDISSSISHMKIGSADGSCFDLTAGIVLDAWSPDTTMINQKCAYTAGNPHYAFKPIETTTDSKIM